MKLQLKSGTIGSIFALKLLMPKGKKPSPTHFSLKILNILKNKKMAVFFKTALNFIHLKQWCKWYLPTLPKHILWLVYRIGLCQYQAYTKAFP